MTDDGTSTTVTGHHPPTLDPVPEATTSNTCHKEQSRGHSTSKLHVSHHHHHHHQRSLTDKRSRSSTILNPPASSQLKYASGTLSASRSPKQRSHSVGTRPVSVHQARKTTPPHGDPEQRTSVASPQHQQRKSTSYSSAKT